jgi:AcrR family transcriptional regulator
MTKDNKSIQEERMRGYFIEATKKTLRGEGLKSVNVRNVAKEAGYSYATLYNYFHDIKDLVFECVKDFQIECEQSVKLETIGSKRGIPKIKSITKSYVKYFVQYPGIFELFFLERINDLGQKKPTVNLVYTLLDSLCEEEWDYCLKKNIYSKKEIELKKELLRNAIVGILLFYINRHIPSSYSDFMLLTNRQIDLIIT